MTALLCVYTIICAISFWYGAEYRASQELMYQILGFSILMFYGIFKGISIKHSRINVCMCLFGLYALVLYLLNGMYIGGFVMINIVLGTSVFLFTQSVNKKATRLILKTIVWISIANIFMMILQRLELDFIFSYIDGKRQVMHVKDYYDMIGLFGFKAGMGLWIGITMAAATCINPILSLFFIVPVYISKSSGVVLGVMGVTIFYFYTLYRKLFKYVVICSIIGLVVFVKFVDAPMGTTSTRLPMWYQVLGDTVRGHKCTLSVFPPWTEKLSSPFLRNPVTGFGLDSFRNGLVAYFLEFKTKDVVKVVYTPNGPITTDGKKVSMVNGDCMTEDGRKLDRWLEVHNEFIQCFYEMGLIGLTLIGFIIYELWVRFKRSVKTPELVALMSIVVFILCSSMTQFPFHLARIGACIPVILGLIVVNTEGD